MLKLTSLSTLLVVASIAILLSGCNPADRAMVQRVKAVLASEDRPEADRALDASRRPVAMVRLLGLREGMKVLDVTTGVGYNLDIFAAAVGPTGRVYAHNNAAVLSFRDGRAGKAIAERLNNNRLPNVTIWYREFSNLGLNQVIDVAYIGLNLHDYYKSAGHQGAVDILRTVGLAMKPDGLLAISDHRGDTDQDNIKLHRINQQLAEELVKEAGFKIIEVSEVLANPDDDRTIFVIDPSIRGKTDRFVILARLTSG